MSSGTLQSVSTCLPGEMAPGSLYQPSTGGTMKDAATAPTIAPTIMKIRTLFTALMCRRSPNAPDAVSAEDPIPRDDREATPEGLSGKQAVEWVAVVKAEHGDSGDVRQLDVEQAEAVGGQLLGHEALDRGIEPELSQAQLDGHLPTARHAEQALVARRPDRPARPRGQRWRTLDPPEKGVGVEEKKHQVYFRKSRGVLSKSGAIQTRPLAEPGLRLRGGGSTGIRRTTGLLSLAMTISTPDIALRTSSENRAFASATLTCTVPRRTGMLVTLSDQWRTAQCDAPSSCTATGPVGAKRAPPARTLFTPTPSRGR